MEYCDKHHVEFELIVIDKNSTVASVFVESIHSAKFRHSVLKYRPIENKKASIR